MSATATLGLRVDDLLLGSGSTRRTTCDRMDDRAPYVVVSRLAGFSTALVSGVQSEVGQLIDDVLDMDTIDVLRLGWRKHRVLAEAGRRTLAEPGRRERVQLAAHTVTVRHRPSIQVRVDGAPQRAIHFEIRLAAKVVGLEGVVEHGHLNAVAAGQIELTAGLMCEGIDLAHADRTIDLRGQMSLGDGIPLVAGEDD